MRITIDFHFKYISYQLKRTGRPGQTPGSLVAKELRRKIENTTNIKAQSFHSKYTFSFVVKLIFSKPEHVKRIDSNHRKVQYVNTLSTTTKTKIS